jgi:predicted anti-sigma-YlaC factor YlaD
MTCQELVELVTDYLDGALSREEVARFEEHLSVCPGCETYLEQVRSTIIVTRASGDVVEPSAVSPLLDAFRDWHDVRRGRGRS